MTYPEAIGYLESFINYEKIPAYPYKESLKLERVKAFLSAIGDPQRSLKCIHIAGSKGKGSTCAFIAYILRQAGYKTGLYTSPHLSDFRERIRILGRPSTVDRRPLQKEFEGMISKYGLADLIIRLRPAIEKYNKNSKYGPLSFFEVYTALAFIYFKEKKVDFAVLETGLGGRLDATNTACPLVCAITPISLEHTQKLGSSLREIAAEKAGIIKVTSHKSQVTSHIVVSAPQEKEAMEVIRNRCKETGAELREVGRHLVYRKAKNGFRIKGVLRDYPQLKIGLLGGHQLINASVAVAVIEALHSYGIDIGTDCIRNGLESAVWPGRCEVISKNPAVVLDGAQNTASAKVLKETVKKSFRYGKLVLVLGISKDKDIKGICRQLYGLADTVILTRADNPRSASVEEIEKYMGSPGHQVTRSPLIKTGSVQEAKARALEIADKRDLVLVTGSLFVVGEFRNGKVRHH